MKYEGDDVDVNLNVSESPWCDENPSTTSSRAATKSDVINTILHKDIEEIDALFPPGKPAQIVRDGYNWGKPVGFLGSARVVAKIASVHKGDGVFFETSVDAITEDLKDGLATFRFTDRFPLDE